MNSLYITMQDLDGVSESFAALRFSISAKHSSKTLPVNNIDYQTNVSTSMTNAPLTDVDVVLGTSLNKGSFHRMG